MKLIVGLGNPGKKFTYTRHNLGFLVLDKIVEKKSWKKDKDALIFQKNGVIFAKPQTFMNDSGVAVKRLVNKYMINSDKVLVVRDDIDLPFGVIRTRKESKSSGQKGVKSILGQLGIKNIAQVKIGIGQDRTLDLDKYVLENFRTEEKKSLPKILDQAASFVIEFTTRDINDTSITVEGI